jgi:predicted nucleic acid-binding protein
MTATTDATSIVEVVLVDTDVFSFYIKGDTRASQYDKHTKGKKWALSFATVGELLTWSKYKGWGASENRRTGKTHRFDRCDSLRYGLVSDLRRAKCAPSESWEAGR